GPERHDQGGGRTHLASLRSVGGRGRGHADAATQGSRRTADAARGRRRRAGLARAPGRAGDPDRVTRAHAMVTDDRILVVDDDPTVAEVVVRYLERDGYDVEVVGDGVAALDRARRSVPQLVVLDLMLPGVDGLDVCRQLRELAPVPVIMLTARGTEEDR